MGDHIALQYGGSEDHRKVQVSSSASTTSSERSRHEPPRSFKHGELLTSIKRYYSNAFTDRVKQDAMNLFLGCFIPSTTEPTLWDTDSDYYLHNPVPIGITRDYPELFCSDRSGPSQIPRPMAGQSNLSLSEYPESESGASTTAASARALCSEEVDLCDRYIVRRHIDDPAYPNGINMGCITDLSKDELKMLLKLESRKTFVREACARLRDESKLWWRVALEKYNTRRTPAVRVAIKPCDEPSAPDGPRAAALTCFDDIFSHQFLNPVDASTVPEERAAPSMVDFWSRGKSARVSHEGDTIDYGDLDSIEDNTESECSRERNGSVPASRNSSVEGLESLNLSNIKALLPLGRTLDSPPATNPIISTSWEDNLRLSNGLALQEASTQGEAWSQWADYCASPTKRSPSFVFEARASPPAPSGYHLAQDDVILSDVQREWDTRVNENSTRYERPLDLYRSYVGGVGYDVHLMVEPLDNANSNPVGFVEEVRSLVDQYLVTAKVKGGVYEGMSQWESALWTQGRLELGLTLTEAHHPTAPREKISAGDADEEGLTSQSAEIMLRCLEGTDNHVIESGQKELVQRRRAVCSGLVGECLRMESDAGLVRSSCYQDATDWDLLGQAVSALSTKESARKYACLFQAESDCCPSASEVHSESLSIVKQGNMNQSNCQNQSDHDFVATNLLSGEILEKRSDPCFLMNEIACSTYRECF